MSSSDPRGRGGDFASRAAAQEADAAFGALLSPAEAAMVAAAGTGGSTYARFIPREELQGLAASSWMPRAFHGNGVPAPPPSPALLRTELVPDGDGNGAQRLTRPPAFAGRALQARRGGSAAPVLPGRAAPAPSAEGAPHPGGLAGSIPGTTPGAPAGTEPARAAPGRADGAPPAAQSTAHSATTEAAIEARVQAALQAREHALREQLLAELGADWDERLASEAAAQAQEARSQGYQDGYRDGLVALENFKESFAQQMSGQIGQLVSAFDHELAGLEQLLSRSVARLATELARQVVRSELAIRPALVVQVADEAVQQLLVSARHVTVQVHPDDQALVAQGCAEVLAARGARLQASPAIERGGVRVDSDAGSIDACIAARWAQAAQGLGAGLGWHDEDAPGADA